MIYAVLQAGVVGLVVATAGKLEDGEPTTRRAGVLNANALAAEKRLVLHCSKMNSQSFMRRGGGSIV